MKLIITPKQETIPAFDHNAIAVKHIDYYPVGGTYDEEEITPFLISKILKEIPNEITIYLSLNPDGECNWLEVVSDGKWLSLGYCFEFIKDGSVMYIIIILIILTFPIPLNRLWKRIFPTKVYIHHLIAVVNRPFLSFKLSQIWKLV